MNKYTFYHTIKIMLMQKVKGIVIVSPSKDDMNVLMCYI